MTWFRAAHAQSQDWAAAAKGCLEALGDLPDKPNIGFVYATDYLAGDLQSIVTYLTERTGVSDWLGASGLGICVDGLELFDRPALAVMVGALPADSFRLLPPSEGDISALPGETLTWMAETEPLFGIVHGSPASNGVFEMLHDLSDTGTRFLVGGLVASRKGDSHVAGRVADAGASGALFAGDIGVATGLSQGCTPVGEPRMVTEAVDNVLIALDGQPALDAFKADIGDVLARDLNRVGGYIFAALPVIGSDTGDYTVRNLVAIDAEKGWIAIGEPIEPGERVMFVRRDPDSAAHDLTAMLNRVRGRLDGPPTGALYFSCVGRGASMFGESGREMQLVKESLGDVPLVGFFGNGEIFHDRIYGYTGVIALFA